MTPVSRIELESEHFSTLDRALSNILSTDLAFETYAQIVDGVPLRDVYEDYFDGYRRRDLKDEEPSQEAREVVQAYRASFSTNMAQLDSQLVRDFQVTSIGSREFILRSMEVLSTICHNAAAILFNDTKHRHRDIGPYMPPSSPNGSPPDIDPGWAPVETKPTELYHPYFRDYQKYPKGIADGIGYWAEYRLFGGVVLFDKGDSGTECKDVFIHPVRHFKIYQLSEDQIQRFYGFVSSEVLRPEEIHHGLRFRSERYARRIDPYEAVFHNVYRDEYARKSPESRPVRCVTRLEDDPHFMDAMEERFRGDSWEGVPLPPELQAMLPGSNSGLDDRTSRPHPPPPP